MHTLPLARRHTSLWGYWWRGLKISLLLVLLALAFCAWQVYRYGEARLPDNYHADAAVVLGAAAWDTRPSPVFRERLNHAIVLYQSGKVDKLALTGGTPKAGFMTEAEVGRRFAIQQGVPAKDIVLEKRSRDTYQNLANIQPVLRAQGLTHIVIISDPHHLARAAAIARDLGLQADSSPTPTSRYSDPSLKFKLWAQESAMLFGYYCWHFSHQLMEKLGI